MVLADYFVGLLAVFSFKGVILGTAKDVQNQLPDAALVFDDQDLRPHARYYFS